MTTKGWNARVITAWLANCSLMAFNGTTECFGDQYSIFFICLNHVSMLRIIHLKFEVGYLFFINVLHKYMCKQGMGVTLVNGVQIKDFHSIVRNYSRLKLRR